MESRVWRIESPAPARSPSSSPPVSTSGACVGSRDGRQAGSLGTSHLSGCCLVRARGSNGLVRAGWRGEDREPCMPEWVPGWRRGGVRPVPAAAALEPSSTHGPPPLLLSTQLVGRTPHMAHAKVVVEPQSGMARWMGIPGATRRSGLKLVRAHEGARSASAPCAHAHAHFAAVPRAAVPMPMLCPCRAHAMPVRCATALWLAMPPCRVAMLSMHATTTPPSAVRACIAPPHAPQL